MTDALLNETLTRLMRERWQTLPDDEPPVMQQQVEEEEFADKELEVKAEVKAEFADENLQVVDEITDADTLQKLYQPASSAAAADADASNAAAHADAPSAAAHADALKARALASAPWRKASASKAHADRVFPSPSAGAHDALSWRFRQSASQAHAGRVFPSPSAATHADLCPHCGEARRQQTRKWLWVSTATSTTQRRGG